MSGDELESYASPSTLAHDLGWGDGYSGMSEDQARQQQGQMRGEGEVYWAAYQDGRTAAAEHEAARGLEP